MVYNTEIWYLYIFQNYQHKSSCHLSPYKDTTELLTLFPALCTSYLWHLFCDSKFMPLTPCSPIPLLPPPAPMLFHYLVFCHWLTALFHSKVPPKKWSKDPEHLQQTEDIQHIDSVLTRTRCSPNSCKMITRINNRMTWPLKDDCTLGSAHYFIFLYWFLPYGNMNQPQVYICPPPSWILPISHPIPPL